MVAEMVEMDLRDSVVLEASGNIVFGGFGRVERMRGRRIVNQCSESRRLSNGHEYAHRPRLR